MQIKNKNQDYIFEIIHDIKAPILSMDYALKNIKKDEILNEIYKTNKHNLNYIESLITNYSITKGKYCLKYELINLVKMIEEELSALNFIIKEKNLRVIISKDKIEDEYIVSDKNLLRQIILNLLNNAIKFSPINNTIKIIFEKTNNKFSICFINNFEKKQKNFSTKIGMDIIKKNLKVIKGKLKITNSKNEICYNISFNC